MTVKDIAELCGVSDQTVFNWMAKLESLNQEIWLRIRDKLAASSPEHPSDYNLEETLAIIGDGGGHETLAALLEENAKNKNALAAYNPAGSPLWDIDRLIEAKIAEALSNTTALTKSPSRNTQAFNAITKAIGALKKWDGRWYPVTQDEFDGVLKLLVSVKNYLADGKP